MTLHEFVVIGLVAFERRLSLDSIEQEIRAAYGRIVASVMSEVQNFSMMGRV